MVAELVAERAQECAERGDLLPHCCPHPYPDQHGPRVVVAEKLARPVFSYPQWPRCKHPKTAARDFEETSPVEGQAAAPPILITTPAAKPARRALPEHLPRETQMHAPKQAKCDCGGELRKLGEDVSEVLEYVPEHFKVIRHVRTKLSCTKCDCIVQAAAPSRPIERAWPGLDCWRTCWSRSTAITSRSIASRRSTRVTAWSWSAQR